MLSLCSRQKYLTVFHSHAPQKLFQTLHVVRCRAATTNRNNQSFYFGTKWNRLLHRRMCRITSFFTLSSLSQLKATCPVSPPWKFTMHNQYFTIYSNYPALEKFLSVFKKGTRGEIIGWDVHIGPLASDDMFGISHKEFSLCSTAKFQKQVFGLSRPTEHLIYIL